MANNSNIINGLYHKSEYLVNCRKEKNMVMLILRANFAKTFHSIHTINDSHKYEKNSNLAIASNHATAHIVRSAVEQVA